MPTWVQPTDLDFGRPGRGALREFGKAMKSAGWALITGANSARNRTVRFFCPASMRWRCRADTDRRSASSSCVQPRSARSSAIRRPTSCKTRSGLRYATPARWRGRAHSKHGPQLSCLRLRLALENPGVTLIAGAEQRRKSHVERERNS
jgi:hypothetical protein